MRGGRSGDRARKRAARPLSTERTLRAMRASCPRVHCATTATTALKIAITKLETINNNHWENLNA
jgi:hypothetical protein